MGKSAEKTLLDYQSKISNILESFTDAFFEVDASWTVIYWNREAERLMNMPRSQIIGRNLWEVYHDAIPLKFYTEYQKAAKENISVRFEEYFPPVDLWFEVAAFPSGAGLSVHFKDITQQKKARRQLMEEKQKYTDLFNLSPLPQWVYDTDSLEFLDVNEAAVEHYGYERSEFLNMTISDIRPEEDLASLYQILQATIRTGVQHKRSMRHRKKNGEVIQVFVESNSLIFEGRNARLVMVIDRTAELKSRDAMQESITRFNLVSKATSDAIWDLNMLDGKMDWNQGIRGIFGYQKTSYDQAWWKQRVHPNDLERVLKEVEMVIGKGEEKLSVEYQFQRADGSYRCVLDRVFLMFSGKGEPLRMIGSMQDITDKVNHIKAIEEQNKKLNEISWIQSHKVRAPLSRILGLAELINSDYSSTQEYKEVAAYIHKAAMELDGVLKEIVKKT